MSTPLRQLLDNILFDDKARAEFGADADAFLLEHGWTTLEGAELEEAVASLSDAVPVQTAQTIDSILEDVDFSGESLAVIGADLAHATAGLTLDHSGDMDDMGETVSATELQFGAGAELEANTSDDTGTTATSDADAFDEVPNNDPATSSSDEAMFEDDVEGIDIDEPLVHDVSGADTSETGFDLEESGIDDLDT